jgi:hypothetical protein
MMWGAPLKLRVSGSGGSWTGAKDILVLRFMLT